MKDQEKFLLIGIDTGVNTGIAIYNTIEGRFTVLETTSILKAFVIVKQAMSNCRLIVVEDARQVRYGTSRYKSQGAGSVKRDCGIWQEFVDMYGMNSKFVRPNKKITKIDSKMFERITGYKGRTNEHNRDAGMLIYSMKGILG